MVYLPLDPHALYDVVSSQQLVPADIQHMLSVKGNDKLIRL